MNSTIQIYQQFDQLQRAAIALHQSGFFSDVKSQAQAIVKVMAGAELGLPPFASMTGINIIQGKPILGANALATLVKNDPRYDYNVKTCNDQECTLEWFESGTKRGTSGFTIKEAQQAGLTNKDNWKKYPSDMLFARAISRGARRFAPGIFGGSPVYTPDEMGMETDPDGYIDTEVTEIVEDPQPEPIESIDPLEMVMEPIPAPKPAKAKEPTLPELMVQEGISENVHAAVSLINKHVPQGIRHDTAMVLTWGKIYRGWRDMGKEVEEAAELADKMERPS